MCWQRSTAPNNTAFSEIVSYDEKLLSTEFYRICVFGVNYIYKFEYYNFAAYNTIEDVLFKIENIFLRAVNKMSWLVIVFSVFL